MNLYLAKSKWISKDYPNPKDLMNIDLFMEYEFIDCILSAYQLNKLCISNIKINSNDMQMIRDNGFTVLWHSNGLYWLLFDIDNPVLLDFTRDFKIRQILDNRESKLNDVLSI